MAKKAKIREAKKKNFWYKLSYTKRGGLVGMVSGLILFIALHNDYFNTTPILGLGSVINHLFPLFLIELVLPLVYGLIIGSLYNRVSKIKFLVILLVTTPLLILFISILILYVARPY